MRKPKTPVERIGLLVTIVGVVMVAIGSVARFPSLDAPPNRPEFDAAALESWRVKEEAKSRKAQNRVDYSSLPLRESAGLERSTELAPDLGPLPTRDPLAHWTVSSYFAQTIENFEESIFEPVAWDQKLLSYGSLALLAGLYFWLLFRHTLLRLYRWVSSSKLSS